jgi:serpin B
MKKTGLIVGVVLIGVAALAHTFQKEFSIDKTTVPNNETVAEGNYNFAFDLYSKLRQEKDGNLFFSPYSISAALAMTYSGAKGNTATEMSDVMHFNADQEKFHSSFKTLVDELATRNQNGVQLNIANSIWVDKSYTFLKGYLAGVKKYYGSSINQVDFVNKFEANRIKINKWVENKTNKKIKDLLSKGVLDEETRQVLVNAIYFKGTWLNKFKKSKTQKMPFHKGKQAEISTNFMKETLSLPYYEDKKVQAIQLPYAGNKISMVIVLPRERNGIAELEKSISGDKFKTWTLFRNSKVDLSLPKFKMTCQFSLGKALIGMGMKEAFTNGADFSGMTGKKDLKISAIIHKAFIEVGEEGTEAAAATAVVMRTKSASINRPSTPKVFKADHPFLFVIRDNSTNSILFMGRMVNPAE